MTNKYLQSVVIKLVMLLTLVILVSYTQSTYAAVSYKEDPIGVILCTLSWKVRQKVTRVIAIIGVIALAILALKGKIAWQYAIMIIVGIVIMMKTDDLLRF